jgi:uncharacterized Rmd1/YagE family protein
MWYEIKSKNPKKQHNQTYLKTKRIDHQTQKLNSFTAAKDKRGDGSVLQLDCHTPLCTSSSYNLGSLQSWLTWHSLLALHEELFHPKNLSSA